MIDFERIEGFDWDAGNARKNERHGVSQVEAEDVFFDPRLLVAPDPAHSAVEPRFHAHQFVDQVVINNDRRTHTSHSMNRISF